MAKQKKGKIATKSKKIKKNPVAEPAIVIYDEANKRGRKPKPQWTFEDFPKHIDLAKKEKKVKAQAKVVEKKKQGRKKKPVAEKPEKSKKITKTELPSDISEAIFAAVKSLKKGANYDEIISYVNDHYNSVVDHRVKSELINLEKSGQICFGNGCYAIYHNLSIEEPKKVVEEVKKEVAEEPAKEPAPEVVAEPEHLEKVDSDDKKPLEEIKEEVKEEVKEDKMEIEEKPKMAKKSEAKEKVAEPEKKSRGKSAKKSSKKEDVKA